MAQVQWGWGGRGVGAARAEWRSGAGPPRGSRRLGRTASSLATSSRFVVVAAGSSDKPPRAPAEVEGFSGGSRSPERKAAELLLNLFTYVSVRIIMLQLEGSGRGDLGSYDPVAYKQLEDALAFSKTRPRGFDGDVFVKRLLTQNKSLAIRLMDVRATYAEEDFDFESLKRLTGETARAANLAVMRESLEIGARASEGDEVRGGEGASP